MNLIKIGSGTIVIQNFLLIVFGIFNIYIGFPDYPIRRDTFLPLPVTVFVILTILFSLDLLGFLIFAIGLFRKRNQGKQLQTKHTLAALGILGWIITRLFIQILFVHASDYNGGFRTNDAYYMYAINATTLLISGITQFDVNFFYYSLANVSILWILVLTIYNDGFVMPVNTIFLLKAITMPIIGIFTFGSIFRFDLVKHDLQKFTTDPYPEFQ